MSAPDANTSAPLRHVFIVGCRRSGTTWLATLLAQHPQVVTLQQSGFFLSLNAVTDWLETQRKYGRAVLTSAAESKAADGLTRHAVAGLFPIERYYELVRPLAENVYAHIARCAPETTMVVDQQPEHVALWRHILAILPGAMFLHLIRDPRSVFSSYWHAAKSWSTGGTFTADPIEFGREWCQAVQQGRSIGAATSRYVEVRYETLRKTGAEELERIHRELGLPTSRALCERAIEACAMDKLREAARGPATFFRRGEAESWRRELSRTQQRIVEYVCAEQMRELGYAPEVEAGGRKPFAVWRRDFKGRIAGAGRRWMREDQGWIKRAARGVGRLCPPLRRLAWRMLR